MGEHALERARNGDEQAFRELTDPYRWELRVHCYRMLGSFADAEDLLQETLIAAWRGLGGFAGRSTIRTWLYRIATNRCLNALRDGARRRPPEPDPPFDPPEPSYRGELTWLQPYPDALLPQITDPEPGPEARYDSREAVELAFVRGLQRLPPRQIAVLVLRDVLGFDAAETAEVLATTPTAIKGMLQRARANLAGQHPTDPERVPRPDSPHERELAVRFADAFTASDIEGLVALLSDGAWLAMPPAPHEYHGTAAITDFLRVFFGWRDRRLIRVLPTRANNRPAFACYLTGPDDETAYPAGVLVLEPGERRIHNVTWFLDTSLPLRFALPETLP